VVQPYSVGTKNKESRYKSMAIVIPKDVVEHFNIDTSSILLLQKEKSRKKITLSVIHEIEFFNGSQKETKSAGESLHPVNQQTAQ
jgi:hypothetical protein